MIRLILKFCAVFTGTGLSKIQFKVMNNEAVCTCIISKIQFKF